MSFYNEKRKRSTRERIGFYTALSICMVAVGMAAYSTYVNLNTGEPETRSNVAVNETVTGVTVTSKPTKPQTEPATETESTAAPTTEPTESEETAPAETKTALETMLTVKSTLSFPLDSAKVVKEYSEESVYNKTLNEWSAHTGVDLACEKGDNVYSMGNGTVTKVYKDDLLGKTVVVKSPDYTAYYSGLSKDVKVKRDDTVSTGDVIGTADGVPSEEMDGTHIHVSVKVNGQYADPLALINNDE